MNLRSFVSYIFLLTFVGLAILVTTRIQEIQDWWFLRSYEPTAEISILAKDSFLSDEGRDLFYVSDPEINQSVGFNQNCPFRERSYVLGCYAGSRIYIFDVTDERLDGIMEVTAAHETLHAAYGRLTLSETEDLNALLDAQLEATTSARVLELIEQYRQQDADSIYSEMHSIFGTEVLKLMPELEEYFKKFFEDRAALVKLSIEYESVFEELREEADIQLAKINASRLEIESLEIVVTAQKAQIQTLETELVLVNQEIENARSNNDSNAEQAAVNAYNSSLQQLRDVIATHNANVERFNGLVADINSQVESYNALVVEQGQLVDSIDSKKETVNSQ